MDEKQKSIYIGFDPREQAAFHIARHSMLRRMSHSIPIYTLALGDLRARGLYNRPTLEEDNRLIDVLSKRADYDGSISTQHAIARFFVPLLAHTGWALFMDGDMLVREDICKVFEGLDPSKAIYCVKHVHAPVHTRKMDGQMQTVYPRKNWSSFALWNCEHPSNSWLDVIVNSRPGRDLHAFFWLNDDEIGELDPRWNHLVGWSKTTNPFVAHFTEGTPDMPGYEKCEYAEEWRQEAGALRLEGNRV